MMSVIDDIENTSIVFVFLFIIDITVCVSDIYIYTKITLSQLAVRRCLQRELQPPLHSCTRQQSQGNQ